MDIFEKCYAPSLAKELKEAGVYPYFTRCNPGRTWRCRWRASAGSCWAPTTIWA